MLFPYQKNQGQHNTVEFKIKNGRESSGYISYRLPNIHGENEIQGNVRSTINALLSGLRYLEVVFIMREIPGMESQGRKCVVRCVNRYCSLGQ